MLTVSGPTSVQSVFGTVCQHRLQSVAFFGADVITHLVTAKLVASPEEVVEGKYATQETNIVTQLKARTTFALVETETYAH